MSAPQPGNATAGAQPAAPQPVADPAQPDTRSDRLPAGAPRADQTDVPPPPADPAEAAPTSAGPADPQDVEPSPAGPGSKRRSGLRNPAAAVRGLGAGALVMEALVLLLAIQPIRVLGGQLSGVALTAVIVLAGVAVVLAGMMGRAWAWHVGSVLQVALLLGGVLHWSLSVLGVIFGLVWAYVLHVRRVILR